MEERRGEEDRRGWGLVEERWRQEQGDCRRWIRAGEENLGRHAIAIERRGTGARFTSDFGEYGCSAGVTGLIYWAGLPVQLPGT